MGRVKRTKNVLSIISKQKNKCFYCGSLIDGSWQGDHKTPSSKGGSNNVENIVISCRLCNLYKSDIPYEMRIKIMDVYKKAMKGKKSKILLKQLKKTLLEKKFICYSIGQEYEFNYKEYENMLNSKNILLYIIKDRN